MTDRDAVLVGGARTPVGRYQGALRQRSAVDLGGCAVRAAAARCPGLDVGYAVMGNVLQGGSGQNPARQAVVAGGLGREVPAITLNDVCLASVSSVGWAASMVATGQHDSVLVGGFESMSTAPHVTRVRGGKAHGDLALVDMMVTDGLHCALDDVGMGRLSDAENERLGISREVQDTIALESHRRAVHAAAEGWLVHVAPLDELDRDEGVRPDVDAGRLAELQPAFTAGGTITAGNASQLSDAGAAGIVASRAAALAAGHQPLAQIIDWETVAGPDSSLHLKPARSARRLLERNGLTPADVDLWEINEAFAGVVVASIEDLGVDLERVNVNGGAIAIGHPLGASGMRLVLDLVYELKRRDVELGVVAICGGGGQGGSLLLRR